MIEAYIFISFIYWTTSKTNFCLLKWLKVARRRSFPLLRHSRLDLGSISATMNSWDPLSWWVNSKISWPAFEGALVGVISTVCTSGTLNRWPSYRCSCQSQRFGVRLHLTVELAAISFACAKFSSLSCCSISSWICGAASHHRRKTQHGSKICHGNARKAWPELISISPTTSSGSWTGTDHFGTMPRWSGATETSLLE